MNGSESRVTSRPNRRFGLGALAIVVVALGSFLLSERLFETPSASAGSVSAVSAGEPRRTSPTTTVGSGTAGGKEWSLRAYTATSDQDDFLCLEWKFGPSTEADDFNCFGPLSELLANGGAYGPISAISQPGSGNSLPRSAFFGLTPTSTHQVRVTLEDGRTAHGSVFDSPPDLGIDAKFFVAFAPPDTAVTVSAYDDSSNQLWRHEKKPLPLLTVTTAGGGDGSVTGVPTDELRGADAPQDQALTHWIDCGNECLAALANASITLEARPADGSIFVGWRGACSGTSSCVLTVDSDKTVTAIFQRAP